MAKQCRFCLESETTPTNEMIEPCACRGSVQYVHQLCLRTWALMDPANNSIKCSICRTPFTIRALLEKELIPATNTLSLFVVDQTMTASMLFHSGYVIFMHGQPVTIETFKQAHALFGLLYTYCYVTNFNVRNRQLYRELLHKSYFPALSFVYILLNIRLMLYDDTVYCIALNMLLNMFWREHLRLLGLMNAQ